MIAQAAGGLLSYIYLSIWQMMLERHSVIVRTINVDIMLAQLRMPAFYFSPPSLLYLFVLFVSFL